MVPPVKLYRREFTQCNILEVEVGTNCPQGGDSGHGGKTILRIRDLGGSAMEASLNGEPLREVARIDLVMGGDSECETLLEALEFAAKVIRNTRGLESPSAN